MKAFAALAVTVSAVTATLTACSTLPGTTVVVGATASSPRAGSTA